MAHFTFFTTAILSAIKFNLFTQQSNPLCTIILKHDSSLLQKESHFKKGTFLFVHGAQWTSPLLIRLLF